MLLPQLLKREGRVQRWVWRSSPAPGELQRTAGSLERLVLQSEPACAVRLRGNSRCEESAPKCAAWWERDLRGSRKRGVGNKEKGDQWGERVSAARSRRTELTA